jgi:hypothetical protein
VERIIIVKMFIIVLKCRDTYVCVGGRSIVSGGYTIAQCDTMGRIVTEQRGLCVKWDGQIGSERES